MEERWQKNVKAHLENEEEEKVKINLEDGVPSPMRERKLRERDWKYKVF